MVCCMATNGVEHELGSCGTKGSKKRFYCWPQATLMFPQALFCYLLADLKLVDQNVYVRLLDFHCCQACLTA